MPPSSGAMTPAIRLNSVVLPAPFGPMTAKMSPDRTAKLTSCPATSPLKLFDTPLPSSSASMARCPAVAALRIDAKHPAQRRPHAFRQHHHHEQHADAVEDLLRARHVEAKRAEQLGHAFGEAGQQERAD